jgi:hypothetical protein
MLSEDLQMRTLKSKQNSSHRVLNNILGDRWGKNYTESRADKPLNYWNVPDNSKIFNYPKHVPTARCIGCGKLLPTTQLSPHISPVAPFAETKSPTCMDCKTESKGWKMQHGISPPYPEQRLTDKEMAGVFPPMNRPPRPITQPTPINLSPPMTPEEKAKAKKEFAEAYWAKGN